MLENNDDVFTDSGAARFFFISLYFELFPISGDV
jgi:hypothetical protein